MIEPDGLRQILDKEEIIPTRLARDIFHHPQDVEDIYKHHVRTYIPLHVSLEEAAGVTDFSKKFLKQVKEAKAPRGYITADFGYGKTSTGLFIWEEAQKENLIAVPPFKLSRLEDLLDAIAGWVKYILSKTVPALVNEVVSIHNFYRNRELQNISERYGVTYDQARTMYEDEALLLRITPKEIVRFLTQMTDLTLRAGFEGLVVIPDELQQYLEPEIKSGKVDPLVPLFDIVSNIMDYQGNFRFGFLMIITSKELGVINDQRGDIIDRLRGNTLDLRTIYDRNFASKLWKSFAKTFGFEKISSEIIDDFTLESLGQISSRPDLSNGPRTVVNVFRRIAQKVLDGDSRSYSPIDLIDDFIANNIAFDARKLLQDATNKALANNSISGHIAIERAIKLIAAFPVEGATQEIQEYYGLAEECIQLRKNFSPELVIEIGDVKKPSLTLRELDQAQENVDELSLILREFTRNYIPMAANQLERSVNTFIHLLKLVFKPENWSFTRVEQRRLFQNAEMSLIGAFPEMQRRFPERIVHIRILSDNEDTIISNLSGDCQISFLLHSNFVQKETDQTTYLGGVKIDELNFSATFELNLLLPCFDVLNRSIQEQLRRVVDIDQVNVLFILSLYHFLQNAIDREGVSKTLKEMIQRSMAVRLLECVLQVLFNPAIDFTNGLAGSRIIEKTVNQLIEIRYGKHYQTLITYKQWRDSLRNYITALRQLNGFAQKQGLVLVEGTKEEIARYFSSTAASFDVYQSRLSLLIKVEGGAFPTRAEVKKGEKSGIYFIRHPLENTVLALLEDKKRLSESRGNKNIELSLEIIQNDVQHLGYREEEVNFIVEIMEARDLIEIRDGRISVITHSEISKNRVVEQIMFLIMQAKKLYQVNGQKDAEQMVQRAQIYNQRIQKINNNGDEAELIILLDQVKSDAGLLETLIEREITNLKKLVITLEFPSASPNFEFKTIPSNGVATFITELNQTGIHANILFNQYTVEVNEYRILFDDLVKRFPNISIESIEIFSKDINHLKYQYNRLIEKKLFWDLFIQRMKIWNEIVSNLSIIRAAIKRFGQFGDPLNVRYQKIVQNIISEFDESSDEAFSHAELFFGEVTLLDQAIKELNLQLERKFENLQDAYRQAFEHSIQADRINLWQKIYYSQNNPEGVFINLLEVVENQVSELLDYLSSGIEQTQNYVISLKMINLENKQIPNDQFGIIENTLINLNDEFTRISEQANRESIKDLKKFDAWLNQYKLANTKLIDTQKRISNLNQQPIQLESSTGGKNSYDFNLTSNEFCGLHNIREGLKNLSDDEFWILLRNYWEQQKVELQIRRYR